MCREISQHSKTTQRTENVGFIPKNVCNEFDLNFILEVMALIKQYYMCFMSTALIQSYHSMFLLSFV